MKLSNINHKLRDIIVFFTYKTKYLTEIRLIKLIYLAELYAIEKLGKRLTDIEFISYYYGPYSGVINLTGQAISGEDIIMEYKETNKNGLYATFFKTTKDKTCVEHLETDEFDMLDEVVRDWGFKPTKEVVAATKETEPYLQTEFGDIIDLDRYKEEMDLTYRNKELVVSVKQSMHEARHRKGVACSTPEKISAYFDSL